MKLIDLDCYVYQETRLMKSKDLIQIIKNYIRSDINGLFYGKF